MDPIGAKNLNWRVSQGIHNTIPMTPNAIASGNHHAFRTYAFAVVICSHNVLLAATMHKPNASHACFARSCHTSAAPMPTSAASAGASIAR